ncbi:MAG: DUF309 domain-containing protein, partial [Candidatus Korobacteraceae bacterium]
FLQGLIQIAVALHHYSTGNKIGARSLLARGSRNLAGYKEGYAGLRLNPLRGCVMMWQEALEEGTEPPEPPRIEAARVET